MRRSEPAARVAFVSALLLAGCRGDQVAAPEFRAPLEELPAGARAIVLASDVRNTWQRAEAHDLWASLQQLEPVRRALQQPGLRGFQAACRAYEARTGAKAKEDLFLNALGGRASLAVYGSPGPWQIANLSTYTDSSLVSLSGKSGLLLVAELADPGRFDSALRALRAEDFGDAVRLSESTVDGQPAFRIERQGGASVVFLREGNFLVAATQDSLARGALALHSGRANRSALHEPEFAAALAAIGQHVIVTAERLRRPGRWSAQGFTWDRRGLHFESLTSAEQTAPSRAEPNHRDEILRSIPDGMTLAMYARGSGLGLGRPSGTGGASDSTGAGASGGEGGGPSFGLPGAALRFVPPEVLRVVGDEIGVALLDVRPTALAPLPNLGIVLEIRDPQAAERALRTLEATLNIVRIRGATHTFEDVHYGGQTFRSLVEPISEALTPSWIVDGDVAILTSTRALMQQFIDTRRTGKRNLLVESTFKPFREFVPHDAWAVAYSDQRRLHRVLEQLGSSSEPWSQRMGEVVKELGELAALGEHFPAGAAYATQEGDRLAVRGWIVEKN